MGILSRRHLVDDWRLRHDIRGPQYFRNSYVNSVPRHWKALACLLSLVLVCFMTVEVAHGHPANDPAGQHCQICAMAHVAVENHPTVFTQRMEHTVATVIPAVALAGSRAVVFTRFIRPPPAVSSPVA